MSNKKLLEKVKYHLAEADRYHEIARKEIEGADLVAHVIFLNEPPKWFVQDSVIKINLASEDANHHLQCAEVYLDMMGD